MRPSQSTFAIDAQIRRIASTQLGVITVGQAADHGIDRFALARRREAGALIPMFREVMRLAPFESTPAQRALAASLVVPGSVIAATSAAVVHQLPVGANKLRSVDVVLSVPAGRLARIRGITVVRQTTPPPSARWLTTRIATPASTLLLLPRFADDDTVERCLDHALAHRLVTVGALRALVDRTPSRAVHKRQLLLDLLADRAHGIGHRSVKEQRVGRWLTNAGLTGWTRNLRVPVGDGGEVEVDFGWSGNRAALEVSPFFTHGSRAKQARDADRRRLLVVRGWRVIEAIDADLVNERSFARTINTLRSLGAS